MARPRYYSLRLFIVLFGLCMISATLTTITKSSGSGEILEQDGRIQLTVDFGETIALSCQSLQGIPSVMLWSWMRTSDSADLGIAYNSRLLLDQRTKYGVEYETGENFATSVLTIRSLTPEDQGEYRCQADGETKSVDIVVRAGVYVKLLQGRGQLIEHDSKRSYDLKVFPGETITLLCEPTVVEGAFEWRRGIENLTIYSSEHGVELPPSDDDFSRLKFDPLFPSRWDRVWRMSLKDLTTEDNNVYTCYGDSYGQATVNLIVTFAAVESAEMTFNEYGALSEDGTEVTLHLDECNFDPSRGEWERYGDFCYHLGTEALTFDEAEAKCQDYGSSLTSIHSEAEQEYIQGMMSARITVTSWIGITDRERPRTFVNTDRTSLDFTDWSFFEPNNGGDSCVKIDGNDWYEWFDVDCTEELRYICKSPKGETALRAPTMSITCHVFGESLSGLVSWYKDEDLLSGPFYRMEEIELGRVHKLTILTGMMSSGEYRCEAEDLRRGRLTIDVQVPVSTSPNSVINYGAQGTDNSVSTARGQNVTLTCVTEIMTPNSTLSWKRENLRDGGYTDITPATEPDRIILSADFERNEWSMTILDISLDDQAPYSCEMKDGPDGHAFGSSTVHIMVYDAPQDAFEISLREHTSGITRTLQKEDQTIFVDKEVGDVTFTCRTTFHAASMKWLQDGRELGPGFFSTNSHTVVETVPGWELQISFQFKGKYFSDGRYTCEAVCSCQSGGRQERTFNVVTGVSINIALNGAHGQEIQQAQKRIIAVTKGDTVSLKCSMKYPSDDIQYLRWEIGTREDGSYPTTYFSPDYTVSYHHTGYGRLSFQEDRASGESTLTLLDVSEEDENVYICKILYDGDEERIYVVLVNETYSCDHECYPETGAWEGNCYEDHQVCDGTPDCENLRDETDCPDLGCSGLTAPTNGGLEVTSYTFGSDVVYYCENGYVLQGDMQTRQCQINSEWSGSTPTCEEEGATTGCPRLAKPDNGIHFDLGTEIGNSNYFKCLTDYEHQGSSSRECQEDGSWTGEATTCHQADRANVVAKCRLARGAGTSVDYPVNRNMVPIEYRTVITVDRDVGSITIACLYTSATSQPLWLPKHNGFNEPAGPLIGDHSVSETVPGVEWSLTIGVTEEGPLLAGDQMNVRAYSRQAEAGRGYFRIDVRGDLPWATENTTDVAFTLTKGQGVEELTQEDDSGAINHIQVTTGSKITLTCSVTMIESMPSEYMAVNLQEQKTYGVYSLKYSDNPRLSITEDPDNLEWSVTIKKLTESDSGLLYCDVVLDNGIMFADEGIRSTVNLTVLPASTTQQPTTKTVTTTTAPTTTTVEPTESAFTGTVRISLKNGEGTVGPREDLPDAVGTAQDMDVLPDQTIALLCKVSNIGSFSASDLLVSWQRLDASGVVTVTSGSNRVLRDSKIRIKEDLDKLKWTLTIKDITSEYEGQWNCLVKPRTHSEERNIINTVVNLRIDGPGTEPDTGPGTEPDNGPGTEPGTGPGEGEHVGGPIDCYECMTSPFAPGPQNCFDPFNEEGIEQVQCEGQCFANSTTTTFLGQTITMVHRGCLTDVTECPPIATCLDLSNPELDLTTCSYCCDGALCNAIGFQEAADVALSDGMSCWTCSEELVEGMDPAPTSCGGEDFNGENALALPCATQCMKMKSPELFGQPASFIRGCEADNLCSLSLPGFQIECCSDNLCNDGGVTGSNADAGNSFQ